MKISFFLYNCEQTFYYSERSEFRSLKLSFFAILSDRENYISWRKKLKSEHFYDCISKRPVKKRKVWSDIQQIHAGNYRKHYIVPQSNLYVHSKGLQLKPSKQECGFYFILYWLSRPRAAWAFDKLKRYHARPSQFNWGPKNIILEKCILWT